MAGPETYSIQTRQRGAAPQLPSLGPIRTTGPAVKPATTAQPGSVSYVGAQVAQETATSAYDRAERDATTDWLIKAAGAIIEPHMQQLQSQQIMKGIQEAAAGKSIDEIRDAPPWYSNIFGDSDLVTAAKAYHAQTQVSKFVEETMKAIPNMTAMAPEEARNAMTQAWQNFQTGDMTIDAVANQQFLNAAPGLFEQWQKQNYKNWQETTRSGQAQAFDAMASSYNQKAKARVTDGTVSLDDVLKSQGELIAGLAPVDGQSYESWGSNLINTVQSAANQGNYHAVDAILKSGLVDKLPADQQASLVGFVRQQENRAILDARITPKYASQIQDLQLQLRTGRMSPKDVLDATNTINVQAQAEYGFTSPFIGPDEVDTWMNASTSLVSNEINAERTRAISAQRTMAQKTADLQAKADADRRELELGSKRFTAGGLIPPGESVEPTKKAGAAAFDVMQQQNPGSGFASLVSLYSHNNGLVIPALQARFTAGLQTADKMEWTPEFDANVSKPFTDMIAQPGGIHAAVKYFGADNYKKLNSYMAAMNAGVPQPLAYHEAFVEPQRLGDSSNLSKADHSALQSELGQSWFSSFFRDNRSNSANQTIMRAAAGHLADLKVNSRYTDEDERVKQAVNLALHDGNISVYGQWAWDRDASAKPLHEQAGLSSDQLYGVLGTTMGAMKQFSGLNFEDASFIERTDQNGRSTLMAYVPDGKGSFRVGLISLSDIQNTARAIRDEQKAERSATQTQLNQGLFRTNQGTPKVEYGMKQ